MDNFQFWLYVIVAVIYVISRAMKKSNRRGQAPPSRERPGQDAGPSESMPPMTFEELLREITEGKKAKSQPPPPPSKPVGIPPHQRPRPAFVDYDEEIEPEEQSLENVDYERQREEITRKVYETAQREASLKSSLSTLQSAIKGGKSSLESLQSSLGDTKSGRFESFRTLHKHSLMAEYVKELRSPSGMKKAVVLSEILKPKF